MTPPDTIDIVLFHCPYTDRYEVSARIGKREVFLCRFPDVGEAAAFMGKWITNRGYAWGPDTARRVDEAQRTDAMMLVLTAVRGNTTPAEMP